MLGWEDCVRDCPSTDSDGAETLDADGGFERAHLVAPQFPQERRLVERDVGLGDPMIGGHVPLELAALRETHRNELLADRTFRRSDRAVNGVAAFTVDESARLHRLARGAADVADEAR